MARTNNGVNSHILDGVSIDMAASIGMIDILEEICINRERAGNIGYSGQNRRVEPYNLKPALNDTNYCYLCQKYGVLFADDLKEEDISKQTENLEYLDNYFSTDNDDDENLEELTENQRQQVELNNFMIKLWCSDCNKLRRI